MIAPKRGPGPSCKEPADPVLAPADRAQHELLAILQRLAPRVGPQDVVRETGQLFTAYAIGRLNTHPGTVSKGGRVARRELTEAANHAVALSNALRRMHREATVVLQEERNAIQEERERQWGPPRGKWDRILDTGQLFTVLDQFVKAARRGRDRLPPTPAPKGRPSATLARLVAIESAVVFERLTGRRPTITTYLDTSTEPATTRARGRFVSLLAEIYGALHLSASAEAQARAIIKLHKT